MDSETRICNLEQMVTNIANSINDQKNYNDADRESIYEKITEIENRLNAIDNMIRQGGN